MSSRSFTFGGAELFLRHVVRPAVGIGGGKVVHGVGHEIEQAAVAGLAGDRGREIGAAVVGVLAGDDVFLLRPADVIEIELDEAQRRIDGGRAAGGEEDVAQVARRVSGEAGAELDGGRRRDQAEGRIVGDAPHLIGDRLHHLLARIADVDAPHAADAVEHAVAVGVDDIGALGLGDDHRLARLRRRAVHPGMDDVRAVLLAQIGGVVFLVGEHLRYSVL